MPTQTRLELHHLNGLAKHGQSREFWQEFGVLCDNWEDEERPGWEWVRRIYEARLWPWRKDGFGWCLGVACSFCYKYDALMCDSFRDFVSRSWSAAIRDLLELVGEAAHNRSHLKDVRELRYLDRTIRPRTPAWQVKLTLLVADRYAELGLDDGAFALRQLAREGGAPRAVWAGGDGWAFRGSQMTVFPTWADAVHWAITQHMESPS